MKNSLLTAFGVFGLFATSFGTSADTSSAAEPTSTPKPATKTSTQDASAERDWSITVDVPLMSKYIWRGINAVDDLVLQPSITMTYKEWSLNVWGNMELTDTNTYGAHGDAQGEFSEIDTTFSYTKVMDAWTLTAGVINYDFPNTDFLSTTELFATFAYTHPFNPALSLYYDIDEANGLYAKLSSSYDATSWFSSAENKNFSVALSGSVAWASEDWAKFWYGANQSGIADLSLGATFSTEVSAGLKFTGYATYTNLIDKHFLAGTTKRSNFIVGAGLTYKY
ncbi:MAG: hypothetical protein U0R49_11745 [Fimbriimonadales bacterium]